MLTRTPLVLAAALFVTGACPAFSQQAAEPEAPAAAAAAPAGAAAITLELNKLVPVDNVCQAYFVVNNLTPQTLQELTVDAYLFDKEGVILRGIALQFADVRAGRATVVPFELPDLPCAEISRVLLNKVLTCTAAGGGAVEGCGDRLAVSTRSDVALEY